MASDLSILILPKSIKIINKLSIIIIERNVQLNPLTLCLQTDHGLHFNHTTQDVFLEPTESPANEGQPAKVASSRNGHHLCSFHSINTDYLQCAQWNDTLVEVILWKTKKLRYRQAK